MSKKLVFHKTQIVDEIIKLRREIADLKAEEAALKNILEKDSNGPHFLGTNFKISIYRSRGSVRLSIPALRKYVSAHVIEMASFRGKPHVTFKVTALKDK